MTIAGWVITIVFGGAISVLVGLLVSMAIDDYTSWSTKTRAAIAFLSSIMTIAIVIGIGKFYFSHTASGQRELIDERSELQGGLERTVIIYTANGDELARYEGKIDIESNPGGYIKFDFDGKRYIYYNCFVETIAELE